MADFLSVELDEVMAAARALSEQGKDATEKFDEADDLIQQLKIDARGAGPRRKELEAGLKVKAEEIQSMRDRDNLMSGAQPSATAASGRARLAGVKNMQEESNLRIETTQQLIEEIEETGADILEELGRNKETINNINGHISQTKGDLKTAEKITTRMGKWWNRW